MMDIGSVSTMVLVSAGSSSSGLEKTGELRPPDISDSAPDIESSEPQTMTYKVRQTTQR
jgi:hypothetical protein